MTIHFDSDHYDQNLWMHEPDQHWLWHYLCDIEAARMDLPAENDAWLKIEDDDSNEVIAAKTLLAVMIGLIRTDFEIKAIKAGAEAAAEVLRAREML